MRINLNRSILAISLLFSLQGILGHAKAQVPPGGVVIDFDQGTVEKVIGGTLTTVPNVRLPAAIFPSFGEFYAEDGVQHSAIGFGTAPGDSVGNIIGTFSHIHGTSVGGSTVTELAPDSGGGFFKLQDSNAFSISGLDIAELNLELANSNFSTLTFRGYTSIDLSSWYDVLVSDDGSHNPIDASGNNLFQTETGAGINGTHIDLGGAAELGSIYLFEYFFTAPGRGNDPGSIPNFRSLKVKLDNIEIGPEVAVVPIPAAIYFFGSALIGLFSVNKKFTYTLSC